MQKRYFSQLATPEETAAEIGGRARRLRIARGLRQTDLAKRARVSLATVGRFEATGQATFGAALRIATALGVEQRLIELFSSPPRSIAELGGNVEKTRKRAQRATIGTARSRTSRGDTAADAGE